MEQKDLAKEYATERLQGRLSGNEVSFSENKVFTEEDIEYAFNAGRESVLENIPKLMWKDIEDYRISYAITPFGDYSILWPTTDNFTIYFNGRHLKLSATKLQQAKQAANEDYQNRIKMVLYEKEN